MSRQTRIALAVAALAGLGALLGWSFAGLPSFGHYRGPYGTVLNRVATPERHATNVVAAIVFDYRGIDTMGEEFILFTAIVGVVLLLRSSGEEQNERRRRKRDSVGSDLVTLAGVVMVGGLLLVGLWLAAFGFVTPGGGFQGGVVLAGGAVLLYIACDRKSFAVYGNEEVLDPFEAIGIGGFVVIGLVALLTGLPFLHNLLGLGVPGTLWSTGSIGLLNWATAIEVTAANVILAKEFLDQYETPLPLGDR
jgi:multicomponent Na+:H+ antiporter subunit B